MASNHVSQVPEALSLGERMRLERALRDSEERFRSLVQLSFDLYWETDAEHRFTRQEFGSTLQDRPEPGAQIGKTRWELPYLGSLTRKPGASTVPRWPRCCPSATSRSTVPRLPAFATQRCHPGSGLVFWIVRSSPGRSRCACFSGGR